MSIALDKRVTAFLVVVLDFSQGIEEFGTFIGILNFGIIQTVKYQNHHTATACSVHIPSEPPTPPSSEPCPACIVVLSKRRAAPLRPPREEWISIQSPKISTRDHHRSPLRSVTGEGLEYNLKTCIPEPLAKP